MVLRYSGTEPVARVMVEAEHQADVDRFAESIADACAGQLECREIGQYRYCS